MTLALLCPAKAETTNTILPASFSSITKFTLLDYDYRPSHAAATCSFVLCPGSKPLDTKVSSLYTLVSYQNTQEDHFHEVDYPWIGASSSSPSMTPAAFNS